MLFFCGLDQKNMHLAEVALSNVLNVVKGSTLNQTMFPKTKQVLFFPKPYCNIRIQMIYMVVLII